MGQAIGYLLTWTCYGTRLHGDSRGTVDDTHNTYGTPHLPEDPIRRSSVYRELSESLWTMSVQDRLDVRDAINTTASIRKWRISRVNVRTNHVHIVMDAPGPHPDPEHIAGLYKSWATRALKASGRHPGRTKFWTNQGSNEHLFTDDDMFNAWNYVDNQ